MSQQPLPFMTYVGGHVLIHSAGGEGVLPSHWTGICVDGFDRNKHWYIGLEGAERSYTVLQARDLAAAEAEMVAKGLGVGTEQARNYINEVLESVDMVLTVLEEVRLTLPRARGETLQDYVERALRIDFSRGPSSCLFPAVYRRAAGETAVEMSFEEWEEAVCRQLEERHGLCTSDAQGVIEGRRREAQCSWREHCPVDVAADLLATPAAVRERG